MIRVRLFREADLPEVREMNPDMAEEICDFSELIPESIVAAEEEDRFLGAAYLAKTSSFMRPELGDGRCFVRGRFRAVPGDALEIEASEALLHALQESVRKLQDQDPEHRVILQIFRDAKELLFTEFMMDCGFFPQHMMLAMERDLSLPLEGLAELPEGFCLTRHADPDEFSYFEKHSALSSEAFGGMPDSIEELRFQIRHGTIVWAVTEGEKLIASMATAKINAETTATERIFCRKEYQRRGITTTMMSAVLRELAEQGYQRARLTLFSDNLPAWNLYRKLGYELTETMMEYHYETNPERRGY
ncbi:MAG: GNAT family N-acetyltransferase [Lachnospiraceae bacterium]|nr:GNAT family N-acetyltransferase [Lachnospiraceae bacterium]